jgi:hypothetical protein
VRKSDLFVVGAYYDPNRQKTPLVLLREWVERNLDYGVSVVLAEHQTGERPYMLSQEEMPHVHLIQVRGGPEHRTFLQYPLYNYAIARLPESAKYVCVQDTDVQHLNHDYAMDTLHMLQDVRAGQTWTHSIDIDPNGNIARNDHGNEVDRSYCAAWLAGEVDVLDGPYGCYVSKALRPEKKCRDWRAHTGYSNAIRMSTLREIGKLPDWFVCGSNDYHFWHAAVGNLRQIAEVQRADLNCRYSKGYVRKLLEMAEVYERVFKQDIGCVGGTVVHGWHGSKRLRFYGSREDILHESRYDPYTDIAYDLHGLPYLSSDNRALRDGLRRYDSRRNADCIRVD